MIINVDSDGTVVDFVDRLRTMVKRLKRKAIPLPEQWDLAKAWDLDPDWLYGRLMVENAYTLFRTAPAYPGAVEVLHRLCDIGHKVRIVTHKNLPTSEATRLAQTGTIEWYEEQELLHRIEMFFTGDKREVNADVAIDDKPDLKWTQRDAINLMPSRTWNQDDQLGDLEPGHFLDRVYSWAQIYNLIEIGEL